MTHRDPTFWLLARAAGLAAYGLLTASALAGLVLAARQPGRVSRAVRLDLHRTLALTAVGAVAAHGAALVLDSTIRIAPLALLVPGLVSYRPAAVAAGVLAAWLLAVVVVSFRFRRRIGWRAWRRLHTATFALFVLATAHGIAAGSDTAHPWAQAVYLGAAGLVAFALSRRLLARPRAVAQPEARVERISTTA